MKKLSKDNANGNDLLNYHSKIIKADLYFQIFITAPLLSIKTINNCIELLKKKNDSILTVHKIYSWFWFNNKPVNYIPKVLPRSQDAKPIVQESTGLYGITYKFFKKHKCRIGKTPIFFNIPRHEALDLDTYEDFIELKNMERDICFIENSNDINLISKLHLSNILFVPLNLETFLYCKENNYEIFDFKKNISLEFHNNSLNVSKDFIDNLNFNLKINYSLKSEIKFF